MDSCRLCENNDKDGDNMYGYGVGMETTIMEWENMCGDGTVSLGMVEMSCNFFLLSLNWP